jgi:hypothetical protein
MAFNTGMFFFTRLKIAMSSRKPERKPGCADRADAASKDPTLADKTRPRRPRFAGALPAADACKGSGAIAVSFAVVYRKRAPD